MGIKQDIPREEEGDSLVQNNNIDRKKSNAA